MNRIGCRVTIRCAILAAVFGFGAGAGPAATEPDPYLTTRGWGLGACLWLPKKAPAALHLHLRNGKLPLNSHYQPIANHVPLMLGHIRIPDRDAPPTIEEADRIRTTYVLESEDAMGEEAHTRITVNRLTPAVLLELAGNSIALFAGDKTPGSVMREDVYFKLEWMATDADFAGWARGRWPVPLGAPCGPRHYFASDGDSVRFGILSAEPAAALDDTADDAPSGLEGVENGWVLLFYGPDAWFLTGESSMMVDCHRRSLRPAPGDAPMLLLCSDPPALELAPDRSVIVRFEEPGARMALLPLYGYKLPRAEGTSEWAKRKTLPEDVKQRCEWWAAHLGAYPLTVEEAIRYEAASDTTVMNEAFRFVSIREGARPCAPLPPMLELARRTGFPVSVSGTVSDSGTPTYCGPCAVVEDADGYEVRIRGLGMYANEAPVVEASASERSAGEKAVLDEMISEVDKVLSAGHLAPVNIPFKDAWGWSSFHNTSLRHLYFAPGQVLSTLAATLPFLDAGRREAVTQYLRREREAYPPEAVAHLPSDAGARREAWFLPEEFLKGETNMYRDKNFHVINHLVPAEALYDLASYYRVAGARALAEDGLDLEPVLEKTLLPWLRRTDWATLGRYSWESGKRDEGCGSYGWNTIADVNRQIAALIGLARLARGLGQAEWENRGHAELARLLAHRYALAKYVSWLYEQGGILLRGEGFSPAEDERDVAMSERTALIGYWLNEGDGTRRALPYWSYEETAYVCMKPELGRFLADYLRAEAQTYAAVAAEYQPDVFMTWAAPRRLAEWVHNAPQDTHQAFLLHAWVLGADSEHLRRRLDVPLVPVGDLYHIDKLVATLRAYRTTSWQPFAPR